MQLVTAGSETLRVGLKVLANVLKAAINADLSANTCALGWQGAMTHASFRSRGWAREENETYRWRAGPASLEWARNGERSIPRGVKFFLS